MSKKDINNEELEQEQVVENQENQVEDTAADTNEENAEEVKEVEEKDDMTLALEKAAELSDKYLRLQAEFDNYRKRTLKEKVDLTKTAGERMINELLPVMDDFERAIDTIDKSDDIEAVKEGIHLIYTKFGSFFKQSGVEEIATKDVEFDTDKHEAITQIPAPSEDLKGKIIDCVQKGYTLNEKVIRHSKVVVGQ